MRATIFVAALGLLAAHPALAQLPPQLAIGQFEIKAYEKIPKAKVAVQLTQDTALGRELRGKVMERIAKRGNEVGFSGGNVLRMDLAYLDLLSSGSGGGGTTSSSTPSFGSPGDNPRPGIGTFPGSISSKAPPDSGPRAPTLRLTFTLYSIESGKVIWVATGSCASVGGMAPRAGEAIINTIFDNADKSLVGDAGCPL